MVEDISAELGMEKLKAFSVVDNMEFYTVYYGEGGYTVKEKVSEWLKRELIGKVTRYKCELTTDTDEC